MKQLYYIITTFIIVAAQPCYSMKNSSKISPILHTINIIKNPQSILCFPKDIVAIEGKKECSIYDVTNKKEIRRIKNNEDIRCIAGHPTKPWLAVLSDITFPQTYFRIYNVETGNKISEFLSQKELKAPLVFNPIDDTIITFYNWQQLCIFDCYTLDAKECYNIDSPTIEMACNPKKMNAHYLYQRI